MKKSLTENIMTSKQSQQRTNARKNKVAFLAMREDISEALEKGWSITVIWETLRDEGSLQYVQVIRIEILKWSKVWVFTKGCRRSAIEGTRHKSGYREKANSHTFIYL